MAGARRIRTFAAPTLGVGAPAQGAPSIGPLTPPGRPRDYRRKPQDRTVHARVPDTLNSPAPLSAAWLKMPPGPARSVRTDDTTRLSLRRDGPVIGTPRVTASTHGAKTRADRILTEATLAAIRLRTHARITARLGAAIAGRPGVLRFIDQGPKGQGV